MALVINLSSSTGDTSLAGLRTLLKGRWGFSDATNDECASLINQAYLEVCEREDWPWLLADATGASPLTITDLRKIETVRETTQGIWLPITTRERIITLNGDPTQTGTAASYYIDNGIVRTFPVGGTLAVRYWKIPTELTNDADSAVIPARFRDVIVTGAARIGMMAESASEDVQFVTQEYERRIQVMSNSFLGQNREAENFLLIEPSYDGGGW